MSDILLVGLPAPEAGAIEVLLERRWPTLGVLKIARGERLGLPAQSTEAVNCSSCVIDLASVGLRVRDAATEQSLLAFLDDRPAILIVRDAHGGWLDWQPRPDCLQTIAVIKVPYSSAQLLVAMVEVLGAEPLPPVRKAPAAALPARSGGPPPADARPATDSGDPPMPAWRRAIDLAERLNPAPLVAGPAVRLQGGEPTRAPFVAAPAQTPVATAPARPAPTDTRTPAPKLPVALTHVQQPGAGLRKGALEALLDAFPQLRSRQVIRLGQKILASGEAVLLHLGKDVEFVMCVREGWLASSIRLPILLRMLATSAVLDQATFEPLGADAAEATVLERYGELGQKMRHPLDSLIWDLASMRFAQLVFRPQADFTLQLRRLPNFTRLSEVRPLDMQLAALCVQAPRSMAELAGRFPGSEQEVYRFVVLAVLSGLARVMTGASATRGNGRAALSRPAPDARRQGFFKSLLKRLF